MTVEEEMMINYIKQKIDVLNLRLSSEYYYNSVVFCIIDAIYSINSNYTSTRNTVLRFCQKYRLEIYREYGSLPNSIENEHTVGDFLISVAGKSYDYLAEAVFENRQRTSTRNGILKAQAVCEFAQILLDNDINSLADIPRMYDAPQLENRIKGIKGQGSGVSLAYFYMLSGNDDLIKADRHILSFIHEATEKNVTKEEAQSLFTRCVEELRSINPHITCRSLDHAIWSYKSKK